MFDGYDGMKLVTEILFRPPLGVSCVCTAGAPAAFDLR